MTIDVRNNSVHEELLFQVCSDDRGIRILVKPKGVKNVVEVDLETVLEPFFDDEGMLQYKSTCDRVLNSAG